MPDAKQTPRHVRLESRRRRWDFPMVLPAQALQEATLLSKANCGAVARARSAGLEPGGEVARLAQGGDKYV
jgi:hypothetical protein